MSTRPGGDEGLSNDDPVDRLLHGLLLEAGPDRRALDELCVRHPEHAPRLRERFRLLAGVGMLEAPRSRASGALPREFGDYTLLRPLGRGGMGEVFLAEHKELGRKVALKFLKDDLLLFPDRRERFRREAQALSRLEHPGICPVYDVGEVDGVPFLAMRYLEGQTLADWIAEQKTARKESGSGARRDAGRSACRWIAEVGTALHVAHEAGFLHRDVKPANILITRGGEAVLLDFGLARDESSAGHTLTRTGDQLGTPAYMAPEQIDDSHGRLDRRADVYSLGATLYEALTLVPPFEATSRERLYRAILTREPRDPSRVAPAIGSDLAHIVAMAMAKDRRDRYATALEFANDLERLLAYEPTVARKAGPILRLRRWTQRNPLAAGMLAALTLALIIAGALVIALQLRTRSQEATLTAVAAARALEFDDEAGLRTALEAVELEERHETVSQLHAALAQFHQVQQIALDDMMYGDQTVVSPDGRWLVTKAAPGKAQLWSWGSGCWLPGPIVDHGLRGLSSVGFAPRSDWFVTAGSVDPRLEGRARIWRADGTALGMPLSAGKIIDFVAFAPDEQSLVAGSRDGVARIWRWNADAGTFEAGPSLLHEGWPIVGSYSPSGRRIVTAVGSRGMTRSVTCRVHVWNADGSPATDGNGKPITEPEPHGGSVQVVMFHPRDEDLVLTASSDRTARLWNLRDGTAVSLPHDGAVVSTCFTPSGEHVLTASPDGTVRIWDLQGRRLRLLEHAGARHVSTSRDGERILTTGTDMTARVFSSHAHPLSTLRGHGGWVTSGHLHADGTHATTLGFDSTVRTWRLVWDDVLTFQSGGSYIENLWLEGQDIVTASRDHYLRRFDGKGRELEGIGPFASGAYDAQWTDDGRFFVLTANGQILVGSGNHDPQPIPPEDSFHATWTPDGELLLVGTRSGLLQLRRADGSPVDDPIGTTKPDNLVWRIQFSPDGSRVLVARQDCTLEVLGYDPNTRKLTSRGRPDLGAPVIWADFHPNGDRILATPNDGTFRILETETLEELTSRQAFDTRPVQAFYSPRGDRFVTVAPTRALLWTADCELIAELREPTGRVTTARFTPDGEYLWTGSSSGIVRRWFVHTQDLVEAALERLHRLQVNSR